MKPSFLNQNKPLLTNMVRDDNPDMCIATVKNAIYDGADAFGLHLSCLKPEYRNADSYSRIFAAMGQRPVYLTNYRGGTNENLSDEKCMEVLVEALEAGGTLCDIMGDAFDRSPMELTRNPQAIAKQMELIDRVHALGKEVLMSSHVLQFLPAEQVLEIAMTHQERGADIAKIVTAAYSEEEELENLATTHCLKKELKIPLLFLSCGTHYKLHRLMGPMLGGCMQLCVQQHDANSAKFKPVLRAYKQVFDNADYLPDIIVNPDLST